EGLPREGEARRRPGGWGLRLAPGDAGVVRALAGVALDGAAERHRRRDDDGLRARRRRRRSPRVQPRPLLRIPHPRRGARRRATLAWLVGGGLPARDLGESRGTALRRRVVLSRLSAEDARM